MGELLERRQHRLETRMREVDALQSEYWDAVLQGDLERQRDVSQQLSRALNRSMITVQNIYYLTAEELEDK